MAPLTTAHGAPSGLRVVTAVQNHSGVYPPVSNIVLVHPCSGLLGLAKTTSEMAISSKFTLNPLLKGTSNHLQKENPGARACLRARGTSGTSSQPPPQASCRCCCLRIPTLFFAEGKATSPNLTWSPNACKKPALLDSFAKVLGHGCTNSCDQGKGNQQYHGST